MNRMRRLTSISFSITARRNKFVRCCPKRAEPADFPRAAWTEPLRHFMPTAGRARALDLGCAVGRSSFELGPLFR